MKKTPLKKRKGYLMMFGPVEVARFEIVKDKLGWGTIETVRKLLQIFVPIVQELRPGREMVLIVRDEKGKGIKLEKTNSFESLSSPVFDAQSENKN